MVDQIRRLKRRRLSDTVRGFTGQRVTPRMRQGWVRAMREALGMSQAQLAARAGISRGTVQKLERAEARRRITLASLDRLAAALGCEVAVALVPEGGSLDALRTRQAERRAEAVLGPAEQSLALEGAEAGAADRERVKAGLVESLLRGSRRRLWQ